MKTLLIILALCVGTLAQAHTVALSWTASPTAGVTYTVQRGTAAGQETSYQAGITGTTYTDTAPAAGVTYFYRIVAVCGAGCPTGVSGTSLPTNEVSATIPSNLPGGPTNLTVTQIAKGPPVVEETWAVAKLPNIIRQLIMRQPAGATVWVQRAQVNPTVTSWQDADVKPTKTYGYEIVALSKNGVRYNSNALSIAVQ